MNQTTPTTKGILCLLLSMVLLTSCKNTSDEKNEGIVITPEAPSKEELIADVLSLGDIDSYNSLLFYYPDDINVLPLSVYMAEYQKYGHAYFNLFYTFYSAFNETRVSLDSATQGLMLYYLEKGVELKDTDCVWMMSKLYTDGTIVVRDTSKAKDLLLLVYPSDVVETYYWPYIKRHADI